MNIKFLARLMVLLSAFTLILTGCSSNSDQAGTSEKKNERVFLNVTTGSNTASVYAFSSSISKLIAEHNPEINLTVQASGGGKENLSRLIEKKADIGVVYGPEIETAINGLNEYEGKADQYKQIKGIFAWPYAAVQLIVREDSGINSIEDLIGKKIAIGAPGSTGATYVWPYVLPEFGMTKKNSDWQYLNQTAAAEALGDGAIDAITALSSARVGAIETLSLTRKIKMIAVPEPQRKNVIKNGIGLLEAEQDPKLYGKNQINDSAIPTIGLSGTFVVREDVPEEVVYNITKTLFENLDDFHKSHSSAKDITLEKALDDMAVPLHPGAEKYFKEKGLIK
ncbi:TAXI family TRAP transporter solute-binding subunit [Peribacillus sp. NPDC097264]|uniref:TAXI family TRAP transporter solute-binding subunit n=1 Tax=Peribacillus sp. NPDC097264 TaxID=3390616 RepID=UPI003CFFC6F6